MLQETFRDNAMSQSKFFLCYKCFKDGRKSVDDDERSGGPSASTTPENVAKVGEAIPADRRQSIHDLCEVIGLSYGTVLRILADNLNTRRISARFLPRLLSDDQKAHRVFVCRELKQQARDDPNFISSIITGDETWVYGYDPETKQQSSQWKSPNSPRPKKARQVRSNVKSMLIVFFGIQEIVDKEFVPPGQTVNDKFYCWGFEASEGGIRRKRPYKWKNSNWFCPKMKLRLKGRRFDTTEEIHAESQEVIDTYLKTSTDAWNHGKHAGIAVYMPKGTTSKETVETRS